MEMLIKIVAYGPGYKMVAVEGESDEEAQVREYDADEESGGYFSVGWNRFDFIVVILSWMLVVVQSLSGADQSITRLVRAFRVARPLRALRSFEGTQVLKFFPMLSVSDAAANVVSQATRLCFNASLATSPQPLVLLSSTCTLILIRVLPMSFRMCC
jgi:hypothetical protein